MVHLSEFPVSSGKEGAACHRSGSQTLAPTYHFLHRIPLHHHGTDKDEVGPTDVLIGELAHVHVHQFFLPASGEHRCHR